jgi:ribosome biogenesis protein NSA1
MPRITSVESPGCPPLRAITTDILGLVKGTPAFPIPPSAAACRSPFLLRVLSSRSR